MSVDNDTLKVSSERSLSGKQVLLLADNLADVDKNYDWHWSRALVVHNYKDVPTVELMRAAQVDLSKRMIEYLRHSEPEKIDAVLNLWRAIDMYQYSIDGNRRDNLRQANNYCMFAREMKMRAGRSLARATGPGAAWLYQDGSELLESPSLEGCFSAALRFSTISRAY